MYVCIYSDMSSKSLNAQVYYAHPCIMYMCVCVPNPKKETSADSIDFFGFHPLHRGKRNKLKNETVERQNSVLRGVWV